MMTSVRKNKLKECLLFLSIGILSLTSQSQVKREENVLALGSIAKHEQVIMEWATDGSVDYYLVQKSTDGKNFVDAGIVLGVVVAGEPMLCRFKASGTGQQMYFRIAVVKEGNLVSYAPASAVAFEKKTIQAKM